MSKLDPIVYTDVDGQLTKYVEHEEYVLDIKKEIDALTAQLADFQAGVTSDPEEQAKIDAAIVNYTEQIAILEAALAAK